MPVVALACYGVFLVIAFGLRAALHWRDTGTTGFAGFSAEPFSTEWCAGVLFALAVAGGLAAPLAQIEGWVAGWHTPAPTLAVGLLAALTGIAGTLAAQLAMGRSWRVGVDHAAVTELVSSGPFRWVRNPIYSWMTLASFGLTMLAPNVLSVATLAALAVALELHVRKVEEPYLLRTHGDAYRRYAAATGRFVPGIGRLTARAHSPSVSR